MRKGILAALAGAVVLLSSCGASYSWKSIPVDGHITGVTATDADNVRENLGYFEDGKYVAPSGQTFDEGITPKQAQLLLDAQLPMRELKQVVAYAPKAMYRKKTLGPWFIDLFMEECEKEFGKKIDVGFTNLGGIRTDMPQGAVQVDDILSMFPFKNSLVYMTLTGSDLLKIMDQLAATGPQVFGGMEVVIKDKKVVCLSVNGEGVDPEKIYSMATIDFLLEGGDGYNLKKYARELIVSDKIIFDAVFSHVLELSAKGGQIEKEADNRLTYIK